MIRTPLRPLAKILKARQRGENPDLIERENLRLRHESLQDRARRRAEGRLLLMAGFFLCVFVVIGARMGMMAASQPSEPQAGVAGNAIVASRADITDRHGRVLATNLLTYALYAHPLEIIDKPRAAGQLAEIFPDLDAGDLLNDFTGGRKFLWIKRKISPEQRQAVHDIGEPGLLFAPREMRLYPNGRLAAHVLGGTSFGKEGVSSAEVIGTAGIEMALDAELRDPSRESAPLELSVDMSVQAAMTEVLAGGVTMLNAKGAAGVLMDVHTGEVLAMASLPDFDPNDRPPLPIEGDPADSPLFNRAVQGVYELGSTFKIVAAAQAMELGLVNPNTKVNANAPLYWGKFKIGEYGGKNYGPTLSVSDVIVKSSNVGTAHIALKIGGKRQKAFYEQLGVLSKSPVELVETSRGVPLVPPNWSEIVTITASYGHGFSTSPMNLAAAYASILNGGTLVRPTLLKQDGPQNGPRVVSEAVSRASARMLREVVLRGTASFGAVPGYAVGGKTGTANKVKRTGGYYNNKNINTFASVFPADDPKYVLIITLDEASEESGSKPRRTAGWTAVPVAAEVIRRTAPLLGLEPEIDPAAASAIKLAAQ
ncbi:peptidoglycan D,D-transpeptidase FtsI family protein [Palleronia caenipelagi]|uniref:Penicillin-binding protein 2 n=1 Tax=Palleronia caenipelagi TaxID=2489174 RepID=A0A547PTD6_9RHOB|nr:penicillin-binding protein 2 [Palleronia caenipelagi]TRD17351.1 penicillin-binding protein 2 [Palleronia caenipelagi]